MIAGARGAAQFEGPGTYFTPPAGEGNVTAAVRERQGAVRKTVVFLGGSITEMNGFRPRVMQALRAKYPQVDFIEVAAGLSSTCSDAGAYRLEEDVLEGCVPDLFIVEAAVNDEQDGHFDARRSMRGMEGIVRHVRAKHPACSIVVGLMVNKKQYGQLLNGEVPVQYEVHSRVARHYGAAVADIGSALAESAKNGGLSWSEYKDCHPSPAGCEFCAKVVMDAIGRVFDPLRQARTTELPPPLDENSYFRGCFLPTDVLNLGDGWQVSCPRWEEILGTKRQYFTRGPAVWSETAGAELSFRFRGTAAGAFLTAGPDAGDLEISVDGGPFRLLRLRAEYGSLHYPYVQSLADDLIDGPHEIRLRVAAAKRDGRNCSAIRIHRLCINGTALGSNDFIWDDCPGKDWESSWYPLGNGELGCMIDGGVGTLRIQFNLDSFWTGDKNITGPVNDATAKSNYSTMGAYQNLGELTLEMPDVRTNGYRRVLDLSRAVYEDGFGDVTRTAFVSAVDGCLALRIRSTLPCGVSVRLQGAHNEKVGGLSFSGALPNGLGYRAQVVLLPNAERTEWVVYLRAKTSFNPRRTDLGLGEPPCAFSALPDSFDAAMRAHIGDYAALYDRCTLDLGEGDLSVPTRERLRRVRDGANDPALLALLFRFGRYLLISSSRPGTLPANLQGIWNNRNNPIWHGDYHTNINIQMNYWGADSANLSECFTPLSDWMLRTLPIAEEVTRATFLQSKGYAYQTSANAFGGGGWRWNFAGAPWMAAQCYDHYTFTCDKDYLKNVAWPLMKGAAEFLMSTQLKEREDGTVVVKDGWSPEHGPREDGVTHDQQIVRELFRDILAAAKDLRIDNAFVREVARLEPKLLADKIGKWGQIQEWETDRDQRDDAHRHTSHLFAVYPGTTISRNATPALAKAAEIALAGRATTGDSRRSWTWPWRAALWARLGNGAKAGEMLNALLRHNTMDNLLTTHEPFQIDGNLGIVAAVAEMLVQSHETDASGLPNIHLLPALPPEWKDGCARGFRVRGGKTVDIAWRDGKILGDAHVR